MSYKKVFVLVFLLLGPIPFLAGTANAGETTDKNIFTAELGTWNKYLSSSGNMLYPGTIGFGSLGLELTSGLFFGIVSQDEFSFDSEFEAGKENDLYAGFSKKDDDFSYSVIILFYDYSQKLRSMFHDEFAIRLYGMYDFPREHHTLKPYFKIEFEYNPNPGADGGFVSAGISHSWKIREFLSFNHDISVYAYEITQFFDNGVLLRYDASLDIRIWDSGKGTLTLSPMVKMRFPLEIHGMNADKGNDHAYGIALKWKTIF